MTINSRTRTNFAGSTIYWYIVGIYIYEEGEEISEEILKTTSVSEGKETYDITKYKKIRFQVNCVATVGGSGFEYYYFNGIEIFNK